MSHPFSLYLTPSVAERLCEDLNARAVGNQRWRVRVFTPTVAVLLHYPEGLLRPDLLEIVDFSH